MSNSSISLSPLDDRYRSITNGLTKYFSEYALFKYRLRVELKYFQRLVMLGLPQLSGLNEKDVTIIFKKIYRGYDEVAYKKIKEYEAITKHDVKALEYYMRDVFKENCLSEYSSFIHFALTSQDINNTAVALQLKDFLEKDYSKQIQNVIDAIEHHATNLNGMRMISRTHGQPAVPTDFGKEFKVFSYRLALQVDQLRDTKHYGKFGGARKL